LKFESEQVENAKKPESPIESAKVENVKVPENVDPWETPQSQDEEEGNGP
jgi:hypothetical protein